MAKAAEDRKATLEQILAAGRPIKIHRSKIKNAPYNPRTMSDKARKKLEAGLRRHGLISLPTWNERTGNLVGGHQRLSILDSIGGTADYELDVVRVDLTEAAEKEANLLLNNEEAAGEFDLGKLGEMLSDKALVLEGTGFDMADVYRLLGDAPGRSQTEVDELAGSLRAARSAYESLTKNSTKRDGTDFYLVVVFRDDADRDAFTKKLGLDENRYQDGRTLLKLYGQADSSTASSAS